MSDRCRAVATAALRCDSNGGLSLVCIDFSLVSDSAAHSLARLAPLMMINDAHRKSPEAIMCSRRSNNGSHCLISCELARARHADFALFSILVVNPARLTLDVCLKRETRRRTWISWWRSSRLLFLSVLLALEFVGAVRKSSDCSAKSGGLFAPGS